MNSSTSLRHQVILRCYKNPSAATVAADCILSNVCGLCTARAIGLTHPALLGIPEPEVAAIIKSVVLQDGEYISTSGEVCSVCLGMAQDRGLYDQGNSLYYAQNSGRFADSRSTGERGDVNRDVMQLVREEQAFTADDATAGEPLVLPTGKSFGASNGDTVDGLVLQGLKPCSLDEAALPLLQDRSHSSPDVTVSMAVPPSIAIRDAHLIARVRRMYAAARASRPAAAVVQQDRPFGAKASEPPLATASSDDSESEPAAKRARTDPPAQAPADTAAPALAPGLAPPPSQSDSISSGTAQAQSADVPTELPWGIQDLKSFVKWRLQSRLRAAGFPTQHEAGLDASVVVVASDTDDCAAGLCVPALARHRGVEGLDAAQRLGKRFKQAAKKRQRGMEALRVEAAGGVDAKASSSSAAAETDGSTDAGVRMPSGAAASGGASEGRATVDREVALMCANLVPYQLAPALLRRGITAAEVSSGRVLPPGGAAQLSTMPRMGQARLEKAVYGVAWAGAAEAGPLLAEARALWSKVAVPSLASAGVPASGGSDQSSSPAAASEQATDRQAPMEGEAVTASAAGASGGGGALPVSSKLWEPSRPHTMDYRDTYGTEGLPATASGGLCWPLPVPFLPAAFRVTITHAPVYVRGRYLKLARGISQSPWTLPAGESAGAMAESRHDEDEDEEEEEEEEEEEMDGGKASSSSSRRRRGQSIRNVETEVCTPLKALFRSEAAKLIGSGREDRDVRMLGRGRPFVVELLDPRNTRVVEADLHKAMLEVNFAGDAEGLARALESASKSADGKSADGKSADGKTVDVSQPEATGTAPTAAAGTSVAQSASSTAVVAPPTAESTLAAYMASGSAEFDDAEGTSDVQARAMRFGRKADVLRMQQGAAGKKKHYCAVCWSKAPVTQALLDARLGSQRDLKVRQLTPVRVLHRRTAMLRNKVVHSMSAELLNDHWFVLRLETSAGTYVKEFVHGDVGRTRPSVGELLGGRCDILQLDVTGIVEPPPGAAVPGGGGGGGKGGGRGRKRGRDEKGGGSGRRGGGRGGRGGGRGGRGRRGRGRGVGRGRGSGRGR